MFEYRTLEGVDIEVIHRAFVDAFSDYQVKIDLPLWKLQSMLQRRGYVAGKSIGAFKDGNLVGFILNGCRKWDERLTVYDLGTGVIPEYRRKGLTTSLFQKVLEKIRHEGVEQYLLEVIQQNTAAYELYSKKGFEITRPFSCYKLMKSSYNPQNVYKVEQVGAFTEEQWVQLKKFWDFEPSWQNSIESICAAAEEFGYFIAGVDTEIVGYGIIERKTGDIPQIAVDRNHRHKGIAGSILSALVNCTESDKVAVLNIDDTSKSTKDFLCEAGFEHYVDQYEMIMDL
ncbi:MAG TPA: GNAT family N-acetyltransferase [Clostridia bacterium]|nr:GNAT family N-acetyltransferase [Clostridia bacterium]